MEKILQGRSYLMRRYRYDTIGEIYIDIISDKYVKVKYPNGNSQRYSMKKIINDYEILEDITDILPPQTN